MFDSLKKMFERNAKIISLKAVEDGISSGIVTNNNGNITTPTSNGHYNLFEFPLCDLSKTFKLEEDKL